MIYIIIICSIITIISFTLIPGIVGSFTPIGHLIFGLFVSLVICTVIVLLYLILIELNKDKYDF